VPAWLVSLLPGALGRVFDFADGWQERRKQENIARHEARIEALKRHERDWKDDYVLIIFSYPPVSMFIPGLRDHTVESMTSLAALPQWFTGTLVAIVMAIYGFQKIPKLKK
jgi:hypothetical protein